MPDRAIDILKMDTSRRRYVLSTSTQARRLAICRFPLMVQEIARQLRELIEVEKSGNKDPDLQTMMSRLENEICKLFKTEFGHDLINREEIT